MDILTIFEGLTPAQLAELRKGILPALIELRATVTKENAQKPTSKATAVNGSREKAHNGR